MAIEFTCPQCGKRQRVPDYNVGKAFKCQCGYTLTVPGEGKISGWTFAMIAVIAVVVPIFYYLIFVSPPEAPKQPVSEEVATEEDRTGGRPPVTGEGSETSPPATPKEPEFLSAPLPVGMADGGEEPAPLEGGALRAIRLGDDAFAEGAYEDALAHYRRAVALDGQSRMAKERMVSALFNAKQENRAIEEAEALVSADPENAFASYLLGCMRRRVGDLPDALTRLRAAVELDPTNFAARHELAMLLDDMGRPQEAISQLYEAVATCRKLLAEGRNDARLHAELGTFLGRVGNQAEADKHLQEAASKSQHDVGLQYILARAYRELGRKREAQQHAERAKSLGHRDAEKLLEHLAASTDAPSATAP